MADETKQPETAQPEKPSKAKKPARVQAVHGDMLDLETGIVYTSIPQEVLKETGWLRSQLEAKKIIYVD